MSRILFASMPFDGHFGPLTGLAVHLRDRGHDVRFYTGPTYAPKLARMGIPHLPFRRAVAVNHYNLTEHFPEYEKLKVGPKQIEFVLLKVFFGNLEAHYRDIAELHGEHAFDAMICDGALYAAALVAQKVIPKVYAVHAAPTPASRSKTAPPPFFGLRPATNIFGRLRDRVVSAMIESSTKRGKALLNELLAREGLEPLGKQDSILDLPYRHARAMFQVGAPGMDYPRDDRAANELFVGPLLPWSTPRSDGLAHEERLRRAESVIVVSQGTVDNRDPEKLFVPALTAFAGGPHTIVVATGGLHTEALRKRFSQPNVIIEDWIDFARLMPLTKLFICNGGYGSLMLALVHGVPILAAGKLEAKNDINARIGWRGLGIDLRTERPTPKQLADGAARVLGSAEIRANVARVQAELRSYDPFAIVEARLAKDGVVAPAAASAAG